MAARRQALLLAARALEQRLNGDLSDHMGPALPCPCGAQAQYRGRHEKTFTSALGRLRLERAYYHCDCCESGFCPRDRALGLEKFSLTPAALRMAANAAALLSFEESTGCCGSWQGSRSVVRVMKSLIKGAYRLWSKPSEST